MSIKWDIELDDKVTPHASAAAEAMGRASQAARGLGHSMGEAQHEAHGLIGAWEVLEGTFLARGIERVLDSAVESARELVDVALEAGERVELLTAAFGALRGGGEEAGRETLNAIRELEREIPQSERQVTSWARSLAAAGVTDLGQLRESLRAISGAEALVEGGGERARGVITRLLEASERGTKVRFSPQMLAGTGVSEQEILKQLGLTAAQLELAKKQGTLTGTQLGEAMVKALNAKAAPAIETQMNSLPAILAKGRDAFTRLFESIEVEPLTSAMRDFFSVFDLANPSGRVLQDAIGGAFNFIFEVAGKVFAFLKNAFLHLIIWALEAALFIREHKTVFEGIASVLAGVFLGAVVAVTVAMWGFAASAAAAAAGVIAATWPALAIGAAIGLVAFAIYELISHWAEVKAFFVNLATAAWDAAVGFVDGLVNGITSGIGKVVDAAKGIGTAAWNAVKETLGVHSPSALMFEVGANTAAGFAGGLEASGSGVRDAAIGMSHEAVAGTGGGGGSRSVSFGDLNIHIDASHAATPQEMAGIVEEAMASFAERIALMNGSAPEPA